MRIKDGLDEVFRHLSQVNHGVDCQTLDGAIVH
jgi:hypothetical protein